MLKRATMRIYTPRLLHWTDLLPLQKERLSTGGTWFFCIWPLLAIQLTRPGNGWSGGYLWHYREFQWIKYHDTDLDTGLMCVTREINLGKFTIDIY